MSSSATALQASTSNAVASYRFFNSRLKNVYESCVLPTKTVYAASHTILSSTFSGSTEQRSRWKQTTFTPPSRNSQRTLSLSSPFLALVSTAVEAGGPDGKVPRLAEGVTSPTAEAPLAEKTDKRKTPFKRVAKPEGHIRTLKMKMLPTAVQVPELKRCFSVARKAYNWANARVKEGAPRNIIRLRTEWRALPPPEWASEKATKVASSIQEGAIRQLVGAYSSNDAKRKKKPSHIYDVRFRSLRKTRTEVIAIDKDPPDSAEKKSTLLRFEASTTPAPNGKAECLAFFGNNLKGVGGIRIMDSKRAIERLVSEGNRLSESAKIKWDKRSCSFHFIFTYIQPRSNDPDKTFSNKRVVATDPGGRVFHTWYSPTSGQFGELLSGAGGELEERCIAIDALQSRVDRRKAGPAAEAQGRSKRQRYRTTRRLRNKLARSRRNLYGWMESAHYDAANFLLRNFDVIIEPILPVSTLTQKKKRVMSYANVRKMLTWSHYKFRERLKSASTRYEGRYVIESTEPGTSKTCTNCGWWNKDIGGDKTYICKRCNIIVDRDLAGARNNFFSEYGRAVGIGWDGASG